MELDPSALLLMCLLALLLAIVVFFGGFVTNPHHSLDVLYGSLTSLLFSALFGWLYLRARRERDN